MKNKYNKYSKENRMKPLINKILIILLILSTQLLNSNNKYKNKDLKHPLKDATREIKDNNKDIYSWFGTLSEVVSIIDKKAFRNVDFANFIQEALKAAVPYVDAHSAFFSKESYKETMESTSGKFSGIGVSIISKAPEDDTLVIIDVIQSGPAAKIGLKGGDKIIQVNGEKLRGLSTDEVINKLKGKVGTEVNIKVIREKKPLEFKIKRDLIKDQTSLCYKIQDQNIYYLSLKIFNATAAKQIKDLLIKTNKGKAKGLILDLRRNPGGILNSAVDMASLFLPKKTLIVTTKDKTGKVNASYKTKNKPVLNSNIPIFILIDNFTASAAEILSGALQYYSKQLIDPKTKKSKLMVFLVGTSTFGKGSVQEVIPISNGCALKLTTMLYFLPNNISIQAKGIIPDFLVKPKHIPADEMQWVQELYGKETSLNHHISIDEVTGTKSKIKESIIKTKEQDKTWEEREKETINKDVQIKASINLINLFNIAKECNPKLTENRAKTLEFLNKNYISDKEINLEKVK